MQEPGVHAVRVPLSAHLSLKGAEQAAGRPGWRARGFAYFLTTGPEDSRRLADRLARAGVRGPEVKAVAS